MNYFIPKEDITHKRAVGIFCMEKRADGTVADALWDFSEATFNADGCVDQQTRTLIDELVFAVGSTADLPDILWTGADLDPLRFAVRADKLNNFRALDQDGLEVIPLGPLWDRKAKRFEEAHDYRLVNVLRRADGWDPDAMALSPFPVRGNKNDIMWSRSSPGYLNPANLGSAPMYQDQKTRELVINDDARAVFDRCDAPALFFTPLQFA